jgi:hypothetical protein
MEKAIETDRNSVEFHRQLWSEIAKENGWYNEPFYVQTFQNEAGEIWDSFGCRHMTQDRVYLGEDFDGEDED